MPRVRRPAARPAGVERAAAEVLAGAPTWACWLGIALAGGGDPAGRVQMWLWGILALACSRPSSSSLRTGRPAARWARSLGFARTRFSAQRRVGRCALARADRAVPSAPGAGGAPVRAESGLPGARTGHARRRGGRGRRGEGAARRRPRPHRAPRRPRSGRSSARCRSACEAQAESDADEHDRRRLPSRRACPSRIRRRTRAIRRSRQGARALPGAGPGARSGRPTARARAPPAPETKRRQRSRAPKA